MKYTKNLTARIQVLQTGEQTAGPVVYVMAREQRVHDNWALLAALTSARERGESFYVIFALAPMFNHGSARHNEWMVKNLEEVASECEALGIPFTVIYGAWEESLPAFVEAHSVSELYFDFNPLEPVSKWRTAVAQAVSIPVSVVDARNIVPCWVASPKAEFAAATFRPKIHRVLPEFLTPFPKLTADVLPKAKHQLPVIDWATVRAYRQCDYAEPIPDRLVSGSRAAERVLREFISHRLATYDTDRNDPMKDGVSDLSPYLRWGVLSAQRVALTVEGSEAPRAAKDAFLEELIVRRELSDNFCYYTKDHTKITAAHPWAQKTLAEHAHDPREYTYTYEQFRDAKTHDDLWNAAQTQMVAEGKMHGYLRMYWAKKILEWTPDPQTAIDIALRLNDTYELDGRDSNGVVGVLWSMAGVHDRAWTERPIFGKIRYMNYAGCKRKFDVPGFVRRYSAKTGDSTLFT